MSTSSFPDSFFGRRRKRSKDSGWRRIEKAPSKEVLLELLLDMYWRGVRREVEHILNSLQEVGDNLTVVENDGKGKSPMCDYDSFIDQVCESSRDWARQQADRFKGNPQEGHVQPVLSLRDIRPNQNTDIKKAVASQHAKHCEQIEQMGTKSDKDSVLYQRAKCFLQAAGLLDIDKLVEYREPPKWLGIWGKGRVPQLQVTGWRDDSLPQFGPATCALCSATIRGIMFRCEHEGCTIEPRLTTENWVCETCFRKHKHPQDHLVKHYKHSILDEVVTPQLSRKLCHCTDVSRFDLDGKSVALWPIRPRAKHRRTATSNVGGCRLFYLPGLVREAKHQAFIESGVKKSVKISTTKGTKGRTQHTPYLTPKVIREMDQKLEEMLDSDVPVLGPLYNYASSKFPFGNTHISIMVGPLLIENGADDSKGGVLISSREPLNYYVPVDSDDASMLDCIALSHKKEIWTQTRDSRPERRLKTCMKQVAGGAFSGFLDAKIEDGIILDLVKEAGLKTASTQQKIKRVENATSRLMEKLKLLLEARINAYLVRITDKLFDPAVKLTWDFLQNNCQAFSDALLTYEDFGDLFGNPDSDDSRIGRPKYLLSFVVRPDSYDRTVVTSKYDTPNGLTEEYLMGFWSGRHDDADIVDTLQEYWHDWGAFDKHLYTHQSLFPWDCTQAYKVDTPACNSCSLSNHVWAFPFDSWSMIQLQLMKDRRWYRPNTELGRRKVTDQEWMENRMTLMTALDDLTRGAGVMAQTPNLQRACSWWRLSRDPQLDRLKLGGIHRAQPYSHRFEPGRAIHYFLAPWAHLMPEERIKAYEALRDKRRRMTDVKSPDSSDSLNALGVVDEVVWSGALIADSVFGIAFQTDAASALDSTHTNGAEAIFGDISYNLFDSIGGLF